MQATGVAAGHRAGVQGNLGAAPQQGHPPHQRQVVVVVVVAVAGHAQAGRPGLALAARGIGDIDLDVQGDDFHHALHRQHDGAQFAHRQVIRDLPRQVALFDQAMVGERTIQDLLDRPVRADQVGEATHPRQAGDMCGAVTIDLRQDVGRIAHARDAGCERQGAERRRHRVDALVQVLAERSGDPVQRQSPLRRRDASLVVRVVVRQAQAESMQARNPRDRRHSGGSRRLVVRDEARIRQARDAVQQDPAVVVLRDRPAAQDLVGPEQGLALGGDHAVRAAEMIGHRLVGPVGQFRERVAELLQDRDTWVMQVVVGPDLAAERLGVVDPQAAQRQEAGAVSLAIRLGAARDRRRDQVFDGLEHAHGGGAPAGRAMSSNHRRVT